MTADYWGENSAETKATLMAVLTVASTGVQMAAPRAGRLADEKGGTRAALMASSWVEWWEKTKADW